MTDPRNFFGGGGVPSFETFERESKCVLSTYLNFINFEPLDRVDPRIPGCTTEGAVAHPGHFSRGGDSLFGIFAGTVKKHVNFKLLKGT